MMISENLVQQCSSRIVVDRRESVELGNWELQLTGLFQFVIVVNLAVNLVLASKKMVVAVVHWISCSCFVH